MSDLGRCVICGRERRQLAVVMVTVGSNRRVLLDLEAAICGECRNELVEGIYELMEAQ